MDKRDNKNIGNSGEEKAAVFLQRKGYKIIDRNLTYPFGEIDILAEKNKVIIIVEVKTVRGSGWGSAHDLVRHKKKEKLKKLALAVAMDYPNRNIRIDVIGIDGLEIEHIENAVCDQ